jgi:hypothetical protein
MIVTRQRDARPERKYLSSGMYPYGAVVRIGGTADERSLLTPKGERTLRVNIDLLGRLQGLLRPEMSRRRMVAIVVATTLGGGDGLVHLATGDAKRRKKRRRRRKKTTSGGPTCSPDESLCGGTHCCAPGRQYLGATFGCVNGALQPGEACDPDVPLACASGECGCRGADCFCRYDTCAPPGVSCFIDLDCCTGFCPGAVACLESVSK